MQPILLVHLHILLVLQPSLLDLQPSLLDLQPVLQHILHSLLSILLDLQHIVLFLQPLLYHPAAFPVHPVAFSVHPVAFPVRPTASISKYAACQYLLNIFLSWSLSTVPACHILTVPVRAKCAGYTLNIKAPKNNFLKQTKYNKNLYTKGYFL
jgi:hypothetical protein